MKNIVELSERIRLAVAKLPYDYEHIFIDNCSTDGTIDKLRILAAKDKKIKVILNARNFGTVTSPYYGILQSHADACIMIPSDLQDPPELIPQMLEKWREGYDVVYAKRVRRQSDTFLKRWSALGFYRLFNWITDTKIPYNTGDFRLLDKKVVGAVRSLGERTRFMKGIFAWVGFRQTAVEYERPLREHGLASLHFRNLWRLAVDGITSFSTTSPNF